MILWYVLHITTLKSPTRLFSEIKKIDLSRPLRKCTQKATKTKEKDEKQRKNKPPEGRGEKNQL